MLIFILRSALRSRCRADVTAALLRVWIRCSAYTLSAYAFQTTRCLIPLHAQYACLCSGLRRVAAASSLCEILLSPVYCWNLLIKLSLIILQHWLELLLHLANVRQTHVLLKRLSSFYQQILLLWITRRILNRFLIENVRCSLLNEVWRRITLSQGCRLSFGLSIWKLFYKQVTAYRLNLFNREL